MKILWATPWNKDSAIARVSAMVVEELQRLGASVCVVRTEVAALIENKAFPSPPLARFPFQVGSLDGFDAVVVNFGDNWPFHGRGLQFLTASPCIAVLHDATLFNFYRGESYFRGGPPAVERFYTEASAYYGPLADSSADCKSGDANWDMAAAKQWPFMHEIASKAHAVVVHSNHCIESLPQSVRSKAHVVMLPAFATQWKQPAPPLLDRGPIMLSTIGHINENKRVASVIKAIVASATLKNRAVYTLAGPIEDAVRDTLQALAADLGFHGLRILGRVTDREMSECLNASHIVCCLRHPTIEGGSASVLEVLQYGHPTLVTDGGFYRQIPDQCVWKVDPNRENLDIIQHLESICSDYPKALEKARRSPAWVSDNCSAKHYAERILEISVNAHSSNAVTLALDRLQTLASSFGVAPSDPLRQRLSDVAKSLFQTD